MSGQITMYGASQLLTSYFSHTTDPPTSFYLALVALIPPDPYMSGSELDEPAVDDYARAQVLNDLANWNNASQPQEMLSLQTITFITAVSDWGQLNYWALCDSVEGGNNLIVGTLESPVVVSAGDQVSIDPGDLSVSLGPFFLVDEQ